ncbi:MAG: hypothetical protein HY422_00495, partial [Candidatus Komeilibacteria bacterium]|nr:hypothetical protein [Candidatus Komeilibacteria bacterium]
VYIDSADNIYVAYVGKRDGSETLGTTNGVYYTKSTDGGANWSAGDTAYSATASDWRHTWAAPSGPRFMAVWRDISAGTLLENYDNSVIATAALTGTVTASITEADIVTGGKTIVLTLSGDNWVAAGATFDAQRQNIINGIDSAQAEGTGWDAVVKATQGVSGVVRTSATVVTITLDAFASYNITATETVTATIPATALVGGNAIVATPTFDITSVATGSLQLTASSSQSFAAALTVLFTSQTSTMSNVGAINVADDRSGSPGWSLAASGADWKSGQDVMQLDYDGTGSNDNLGKLCIKPNNGTLYAESGSLTGVSKGSLACFSASVTSINLITATAGNGTGTYWLTDMPAEQFFPSSPTVASYTTTITLTLTMRDIGTPRFFGFGYSLTKSSRIAGDRST